MIDPGILPRLLDIWLPDGGYFVALVEMYADESYSEERSSLFCVAGYLFEKTEAKRFNKRWQAMLNSYCLTEFHMTDCAHHQGEYKKLCKQQCDDVSREAIEIIKATAAYGFVISVDSEDYAEIMQPLSKDSISDYSFCLLQTLSCIEVWADGTGFSGDVAYTFEAGHRHERDAHKTLENMYGDSASRDRFRISTYAFSPKKKVLPLQAADILAWHWLLEGYRQRLGDKRDRPVRKDLLALIRPQDMSANFTREKLIEYRDSLIRNSEVSDMPPLRIFFARKMPRHS